MASNITKFCSNCGSGFELQKEDSECYKKFDVPEPKLCPDCRNQRRLAHINQLNLFKRKCDATGKDIISNYPPGSPLKVFSQKFWYSDAYDGTNYGKDFDFSKPFFEQFFELGENVPRPALFTDFLHDENSDFTNYAGKNKDCYLIFDSDENRDCLYSFGMNSSRDSMDCYRVQKLELCYETVDSKGCYNCSYVFNSENCRDSYFLNNCIGCSNCIFCSNLRRKEFYVFNKPVSKETFREMTLKIKPTLGSHEFLKKKIAEFEEFKLSCFYKFMHGFQNENCSGDYLVHCKNAYHCFDSMNLWDGRYCTQMFMKSKDCFDCHECGDCELLYECNNSGYNMYNARFSLQCLDEISNMDYCNLCFHCSDMFGCIGLRSEKHCILNKQYSAEQYADLKSRIIEHMKKTGEWGEYFPIEHSSFPYNLTIAQTYFPLTKKEAIAKKYGWRDDEIKEYKKQTFKIPDHINEVTDEILNETLACNICGKNYKITTHELNFYRRQGLPIPRNCFLCRHSARVKGRNPRKLWSRNCGLCDEEIMTTYSPQLPHKVYCENCFLNAIN